MLSSEFGPFPAALYFGDETCVSCKPAAAAISDGALEVTTYTWDAHGAVFDALDISQVPRLLVVDEAGQVVADISGVPTPRQIARAKLQVSGE